jgi:hypothetical protein
MTEQTRDPDAILARYADGPAQLEAAIAGLAEADLDLALSADTWTIRQLVHHVADGDDIWKVCIKAALGNSGGLFSLQWYWEVEQDTWAERWDYAGRAIEPSLALFRANRLHIVQLMERNPDGWDRHMRIQWPHQAGEERITVGDMIEMQANHVTHHVDGIRAIGETHSIW